MIDECEKHYIFQLNIFNYNQIMVTIVIQAGGESRRMGEDKAILDFAGQAMIERVISRIKHLADEVLITTNNPLKYRFLKLPLIPDVVPRRGALGGLFTAINAANYPIVAVVACDMPFINANLIKAEIDLLEQTQSDLVIPQTSAGMEPFHAVYRREACIPPIKSALDSGQWRVDAWFDQVELYPLSTEIILKYDPQLLSFFNVNSPQDLETARKISLKQT